MNDLIKNALIELGCSDNEIATFLVLVKNELGSSVLKLSRELNLPRPTVYGHLNILEEKGLVKKGLGDSGSVYYAEGFEAIEDLFNEKIKSITEAKSSIARFKNIERLKPGYNPKFILYNSKNAAELILKDILRSRAKEIYWFWPLKEMIKIIPSKTFDFFHEERLKRGIWINMLWPEKKKVDINKHPFLGPADRKKSLRRIKILPRKIDYASGYGIYGNKVGFISSESENYGFVIDSRELAETLKSQFDYFWEISKKYI